MTRTMRHWLFSLAVCGCLLLTGQTAPAQDTVNIPPAPPVPPPTPAAAPGPGAGAPDVPPSPAAGGPANAPDPLERKPDDALIIPRQPNIIFIMADDVGRNDFGVYGQKAIATPNIDRLAAEGMRFTNAYAGCTVCAPSRSVLMTGLHMGHTPVRANTGGVALRPEDTTVAAVLKKAGYATGGFGKWGLGDVGTTGVPEKHGFDTFFGYYNQVHAHYFYPDFLYHNSQRVMLPGNAGFYPEDPLTAPKYVKAPSGGYPTHDSASGKTRQYAQYEIFNRMKSFIRDNKDKPFFCYAPFTIAHAQYQIPEEDPAWQQVKDKPWPVDAKVAAAMVLMLDRQVGETVNLIKELNLDRRTIIFLTSDNGGADRFEGSLDSIGTLRGKKRDLYEGGLRVPLIVRWPGQIDAGAVSDVITSFADVMPTLADLAEAGQNIPVKVDGYSLLPTLLGKTRLPTRQQAVHDYLYWEYVTGAWSPAKPMRVAQAVRMGQWKAVRNPGKPLELYDLASDESETTDIAAAHPQIVEKITALMDTARKPMPPQIEPEKPQNHRWR